MLEQMPRNRLGRIVLHLLCLLRGRHMRWHWRGIVRQLHASPNGHAQ
jgi:hypothetical protein